MSMLLWILPKALPHLLNQHHPDVVTLQPVDEVNTLTSYVWDCHDAKEGNHCQNHAEVKDDKRFSPILRWNELQNLHV